MDQRGQWKQAGRRCALGIAAFILLTIGSAQTALCAPIPEHFTVDTIQAAGVTDRNFAKAIYENIGNQILSGNYQVEEEWDAKEILGNYSNKNLKRGSAVIEATNRGIKSIDGIKLLANTLFIYLNKNEIHDLTPLARESIKEEKLYFQGTNIRIANGNFQNAIPKELVGTRNGNITVDSRMEFEPMELNYIYDGTKKTIYLDFDLQLHGGAGGIFNGKNSRKESINEIRGEWTEYADYQNRYQGTTIQFPGNDGRILIAANANESMTPKLPATVHYWSEENIDRKLNLEWCYPFETKFYRLLKEDLTMELRAGAHFKKTNPAGEGLEGAVYILYQLDIAGKRVRYPDSDQIYRTNQSGDLFIENLPDGAYELVETKAPAGYEINEETIHFVIDRQNGQGIADAVNGGEGEVTATTERASFRPKWDRVLIKGDRGSKRYGHIMVQTEGSKRAVKPSDYDADCFLCNKGPEIKRLKGELADNSLYQNTGESQVILYQGTEQIGTYQSLKEVKKHLNQLVREGGMIETTGNFRIVANLVYQKANVELIQVDQPQEPEKPKSEESKKEEPKPEEPKPEEPKKEEPKSEEPKPEEPKKEETGKFQKERLLNIIVKKSWSDVVHPMQAFFQLVLESGSGSRTKVGAEKTLNANDQWTASWSFQEIEELILSTDSNAGTVCASPVNAEVNSETIPENSANSAVSVCNVLADNMASSSNVQRYDEYGMLADGAVMDDINKLFVEEVKIPEGWRANYRGFDRLPDGTIVYQIENRRVSEEPSIWKGNKPPVPEKNQPGGPPPDFPPDHSKHIPKRIENTPKTPEVTVPKKGEYRVLQPRIRLPWGRVEYSSGHALPKTGEKAGLSSVLVYGSLVWSLMMLLISANRGTRKRGQKAIGGKDDAA